MSDDKKKSLINCDFSKEENIKFYYKEKKEFLDVNYKTFKRIIEESVGCQNKEGDIE